MASPLAAADPTAVFARRAIAAVIDGLVILIPTFLLLTASFEYLDVSALDRGADTFCTDYNDQHGGLCLNLAEVNDRVYFSEGPSGTTTAMYWGGTFALLVVLQGLTGRTAGKALTGVRTVGEDGAPPGLLKALLRWVLWTVDAFPYVVPLLGPIVALTTQGHRRVGDMVAKTYVVRANAAGAPIAVPGAAGSGAAAGTDGTASGIGATSGGPQWDAARSTYIQWDDSQRRWMQWNEAANAWTPIDGQ